MASCRAAWPRHPHCQRLQVWAHSSTSQGAWPSPQGKEFFPPVLPASPGATRTCLSTSGCMKV